MKKIILLLFVGLCGCTVPNSGTKVDCDSQNPEDNYEVVKLFEADGISVYRFYDRGHYVYFTNTSGRTSYQYATTYRAGKTVRTRRHTVETVQPAASGS